MRRLCTLAALLVIAATAQANTVLGVRGSGFTLNGKPTFLLGISYYSGLGASDETVRRDLDEARRGGFNWIRVWATWSAFGKDLSAVGKDGAAREPYLSRLRLLIEECDRRGIVVDVTFTRGDVIQTMDSHRRAVETLVGALRKWPNWYLDLSNERNLRDSRYTSFDDVAVLRDLAKRIDPGRLVTASHGGDIGRGELEHYVKEAKVDFISPHRPRDAGSPAQTEAKTREYLAWMREIGRIGPVHYQEPFRRGYANWQPLADDYAADLAGARAGGAAGWCFHNGSQRGTLDGRPRRSFDLSEKSLFEQLDAEERKAITMLPGALKAKP